MVDDKHSEPLGDDNGPQGEDGEAPISAEERQAAEAMARALDGGEADVASLAGPEREAIGVLRAGAGLAPPLGELKAHQLVRAAAQAATRRQATRTQRRWQRGVWAGAAAAALVLAVLAVGKAPWRPEPLPEALCSRPAGLLVPGPFPTSQSPAQRLDVVTEDRLVALREVRLRALAGGRR